MKGTMSASADQPLQFGYFLAPAADSPLIATARRIVRMLWSGVRNLRFDGAHYRLAGAQFGPVPLHPIGIRLGVYGPRALERTGRAADGWIPSFRGDIGQIAEMSRRLDDAVAAAGRAPDAVRRVLNVSGSITDGSSDGMFRGPAGQWVDEIGDVAVSYGFDTFIFWSEDGDRQFGRFAQEVVPAVRERLAR